jgi:L-threonylcarbamoyladenylate synthase
MEIISNPSQDEISKAAKALKDGHLVAFPTETVYGLGADATNEIAIGRIYSVKGRPTSHPLIVHISSINQLDKWAIDIPGYAIKLAQEFWPGPMTLILKRSDYAKNYITGKQKSVGIRVPKNSVALALLSEFEKLGGFGIAAPSANRFGAVSPTTSDAVRDELGNYLDSKDLILDGGQSTVGIESTIIDCTKEFPSVLRYGAVTIEMIEKLTGYKIQKNCIQNKIRVPGLMKSHYSPNAKIEINTLPKPGHGFIAMASIATPNGVIRLASPNNIEEYAQVLYKAFRDGDKRNLKIITVLAPEGAGLADAIRDRLVKSSNKDK